LTPSGALINWNNPGLFWFPVYYLLVMMALPRRNSVKELDKVAIYD